MGVQVRLSAYVVEESLAPQAPMQHLPTSNTKRAVQGGVSQPAPDFLKAMPEDRRVSVSEITRCSALLPTRAWSGRRMLPLQTGDAPVNDH
jgi:hypothetical protein